MIEPAVCIFLTACIAAYAVTEMANHYAVTEMANHLKAAHRPRPARRGAVQSCPKSSVPSTCLESKSPTVSRRPWFTTRTDMSNNIKYIAHLCPDGTVCTFPEDLNAEGAKVEIITKGTYGSRVEIPLGDFLSAAARCLAGETGKMAAASVGRSCELSQAFEAGDWREAFGVAAPAPETTEGSEEDDDGDIPL